MEDEKNVAPFIANKLNIEPFEPNIVLEGGAIEVNGQGLCLTTEECLLNKNRNGGPDKATMELYLKRFLNVSKVIWCRGGMEGDDTDGHIDNLARFVSPDIVVCVYEEDQNDPNYQNLKERPTIEKLSQNLKKKILTYKYRQVIFQLEINPTSDVDVEKFGREIRNHKTFSPLGTNVNFIQILILAIFFFNIYY